MKKYKNEHTHDGGVEEENENYDIFTQSVSVFFPTSFSLSCVVPTSDLPSSPILCPLYYELLCHNKPFNVEQERIFNIIFFSLFHNSTRAIVSSRHKNPKNRTIHRFPCDNNTHTIRLWMSDGRARLSSMAQSTSQVSGFLTQIEEPFESFSRDGENWTRPLGRAQAKS